MSNGNPSTTHRLTSRISYAQNQEDILLDRLFRNLSSGSYVDIGANHPVLDSNTYFFYCRGWRGYNFEPLPHLHELFHEQRPDDKNLAIAVSDAEGTFPFYEVANCDGLSSLSEEVANLHRKRGLEVIQHQIPVRTLASLIEEHQIPPPDFLTIDVESLEEKVVRGIPLATWRPKVLVVESTRPETNVASHTAWEPLVLGNGYIFATFNGVNRFYLREDMKDKLPLLKVPVNVLDCYRRRELVDMENQVADLKSQVDQVHSAWERDVDRYEAMRPSWEHVQELCTKLTEQLHEAQVQIARREANWQNEANWQLDALTQQNEDLQLAADEQLRALAQQNRELQGDLTQIREAFGEQLERVNARFHLLAAREQELREMLLDAHEQLLRRDEEIQTVLAKDGVSAPLPVGMATMGPFINGPIAAVRGINVDAPAQRAGWTPIGPLANDDDGQTYHRLIHEVREVVRRELPADAHVVVISEGDAALVNLDGRKAWHFPSDDNGSFRAEYPNSDPDAIEHLEIHRSRGAEYLIIPMPALWVLDRYPGLVSHLNAQQGLVVRHDCCTIYGLHPVDRNGHARPSRLHRDSKTMPFGVNVSGNIGSEKGTGEAVRATIRSVEAAGIPFVLNNVVDDYSDNPDQTYTHFAGDNPYAINIIQANADMVEPFVQQRGAEYLRGRYNIGYWFWELAEFPRQEWERGFQYLDEVWVGSNFVLDAVSRVSSVPVTKIPVSIPERLPVKRCDRSAFGLPDDKFLFLFIVDFMSIPERKNPHGLIKAFKQAFRANDQAMLVIKGAHSSPDWLKAVGAPPNILEAITNAAADANIRIIDRVMARDEVNALISLCDCYVSLHRSEGFGLPLAEAMSLERPVIATGYSGNMEFMTPGNSFLVKYDLLELDKDYGPYRKGCVWADPSLDHAAYLMRHVYEHQDDARAIGARGRQDILHTLHPQVTGALLRNRLRRIAEQGKVIITDQASRPELQPVG